MTASTAAPGGRPLVLRNVTVVDTRDGTLAPGLDVLIAGGVIAEIDLVLLSANPVGDAASLHQVAAVIRGGRHYSAADLAGLKDRVRSAHPAS